MAKHRAAFEQSAERNINLGLVSQIALTIFIFVQHGECTTILPNWDLASAYWSGVTFISTKTGLFQIVEVPQPKYVLQDSGGGLEDSQESPECRYEPGFALDITRGLIFLTVSWCRIDGNLVAMYNITSNETYALRLPQTGNFSYFMTMVFYDGSLFINTGVSLMELRTEGEIARWKFEEFHRFRVEGKHSGLALDAKSKTFFWCTGYHTDTVKYNTNISYFGETEGIVVSLPYVVRTITTDDIYLYFVETDVTEKGNTTRPYETLNRIRLADFKQRQTLFPFVYKGNETINYGTLAVSILCGDIIAWTERWGNRSIVVKNIATQAETRATFQWEELSYWGGWRNMISYRSASQNWSSCGQNLTPRIGQEWTDGIEGNPESAENDMTPSTFSIEVLEGTLKINCSLGVGSRVTYDLLEGASYSFKAPRKSNDSSLQFCVFTRNGKKQIKRSMNFKDGENVVVSAYTEGLYVSAVNVNTGEGDWSFDEWKIESSTLQDAMNLNEISTLADSDQRDWRVIFYEKRMYAGSWMEMRFNPKGINCYNLRTQYEYDRTSIFGWGTSFANRASSVYLGPFCVRLYDEEGCLGNTIELTPTVNQDCQDDLAACGFDKRAASASPCAFSPPSRTVPEVTTITVATSNTGLTPGNGTTGPNGK